MIRIKGISPHLIPCVHQVWGPDRHESYKPLNFGDTNGCNPSGPIVQGKSLSEQDFIACLAKKLSLGLGLLQKDDERKFPVKNRNTSKAAYLSMRRKSL